MIYNFDTIPLEQAKELIIKYKKTKDKETFDRLILIFDDYIRYLIRKFKNKFSCLRYESLQILYPTAIIGLEDAFCKFHEDWKVNKICLWIGSYVKYHLLSDFRYKEKEICFDEILVESKEVSGDRFSKDNSDSKFAKHMNQINIRNLLSSKILDSKELKFIKLKYYDCVPSKEIAKQMKISSSMVTITDKRICAKLKKIIQDEEK